MNESRAVQQINRTRNIVEDLDCGGRSALERFRDDSGMNALGQQSLRGAQQAASNDNNGGCPVTCLNILGRTQINQHPRGRVHNAHISQHGVSVVGLRGSVSGRNVWRGSYDDRVSFGCLNLTAC